MPKTKFFKKDKPTPNVKDLEEKGAFIPNEEQDMSPEELIEFNKKKQELFSNSFGGNRFADITKSSEAYSTQTKQIKQRSTGLINEDVLEAKIVEIINRRLPAMLIEFLEEK